MTIQPTKLYTMKSNRIIIALVASLFSFSCFAQQSFPDFPPADVTREMDWAQMLWQMGITLPELPPKLEDPNAPKDAYPQDSTNTNGNWRNEYGHTITRSAWGLWNNYDDKPIGFFPGKDTARLGGYEVINLLKMNDGSIITTKEEWWSRRRPEILKDAMEALYGNIPADSILPKVTFSVETTSGGIGEFAYIQKKITGTIDVSRYPQVRDVPVISAVLRTPAEAKVGVPVLVSFAGFGNRLEQDWEQAAPNGWGVCTFNPQTVQPDNGVGLTSYLIGLVNKGNWRKPSDWGSIGAWSWGISRLIDYFETDQHVDAMAIGLTGHSRYGKATLFVLAVEPRLAIGFPSDGGSLGTAVNRRHWGQDLENSGYANEYHWMAGNFFQWAGEKTQGQYLPRKIEDCPVDSYSLLALCAPRPMLLNGGNHSSWTDPYGQYLTTLYATPAYEFLGVKGIVMNDEKPILDKGYTDGTLAYRYHDGGHTYFQEWPTFYKFSKKFIKAPILKTTSSIVTLSNLADEKQTLDIESNEKWQLSCEADWLDFASKSGEGSGSIEYSVKQNKSKTGRSAVVTLSSNGRKTLMLINQGSKKPSLEITKKELVVDKGLVSFDITSNTAWELSGSEDWLMIPTSGGVNSGKASISAANNPNVEKRSAELTVTAKGVEPVKITVTQLEGDPTLRVSTTALKLGSEEGSSAGFWGFSNTNLTVETSADWMTTSASSAPSGFQRMTLKAAKNTTGGERTGTVTILVKNMEPHVITVVQEK